MDWKKGKEMCGVPKKKKEKLKKAQSERLALEMDLPGVGVLSQGSFTSRICHGIHRPLPGPFSSSTVSSPSPSSFVRQLVNTY